MKTAFEPLVYTDSKILILGTMPGEKSLEVQEYYGNRGNQFWRLLFLILGRELTSSYDDKKELLKEHRIAVWDVLAYCEREGSLDSKIKNEKPNSFSDFYGKYPNIKHVLFSSKNAEAYYKKYVGLQANLTYDTLSSPSGANATKSFLEKFEDWSKKILPLINQ